MATVPLQGHDFTGLGFTIHGNITQGLFIKEVMKQGPASESGQISPGKSNRVKKFESFLYQEISIVGMRHFM